MESVVRKSNIRVVIAYRTISYEEAAVISAQLPIDLRIIERTRAFEGEKANRKRTIEE